MPAHKYLFWAAIVSLTLGFPWCQGAVADGPIGPPKIIYVDEFGAIGDGKTDDQDALSRAFQRASNESSAQQLVIVSFGAGTYLHSGQLSIGGHQLWILGPPNNGTLQGTNAKAQALLVGTITIHNMNISGVAGGDPAIQGTAGANVSIANCKIQGVTDCVHLNGGLSLLNGCTFLPGANGIALKLQAPTAMNLRASTFLGSGNASDQTGIQCSGGVLTVSPRNSFSNLGIAISSTDVKELKIVQNSFSNCASSINVRNSQTVQIDRNSLSNTYPINIFNSNPVAITNNQLVNMQTQAVLCTQNPGTVRVDGNSIVNCGLSSATDPPAVIYCDAREFVPFNGSLSITNNVYVGNTQHLQYFIETPISSASVVNNKTNTTLPNKIGP